MITSLILMLIILLPPPSTSFTCGTRTEEFKYDSMLCQFINRSINFRTSFYVLIGAGVAKGDVPGVFEHYEEGYFYNSSCGIGWIKITLHTEDGSIIHLELGRPNDPYIWIGRQDFYRRTVLSGPVYLEGEFLCWYETTAFGVGKMYYEALFPVGRC